MQLQLYFLGTGGAAPTKNRNLSALVLRFEGSMLLFDCPEGTQQQMMRAGVSMMKLDAIFLSHFHADHILGLPGMLATMNMLEREEPLTVYGPKGIEELLDSIITLAVMDIDFDVRPKVLRKGVVMRNPKFTVSAFPLKHNTRCFGFVFKEKDKPGEFQREKAIALGIPVGPLFRQLQEGKSVKVGNKLIKPEQVMDYSKGIAGRKVAIVMDTRPDDGYISFIKHSDVLVHEAVFAEDMRERALETWHCTAKEAAEIARKARASKLIITHFSPRYAVPTQLLKEARELFSETVAARDLMVLELPRKKVGSCKR